MRGKWQEVSGEYVTGDDKPLTGITGIYFRIMEIAAFTKIHALPNNSLPNK